MDHTRRRHLLQHPNEVLPGEFNYRLLDAIFRKKYGYGGGPFVMVIGGIRFTKTLKLRFSNSGKSKCFKIVIEGDGYRFENKTPFDGNRRYMRR